MSTNEVSLEGFITGKRDDPNFLRQFGKINTFTLKAISKPDDPYNNDPYYNVKFFDEELAEGLSKGERVIVTGRLQKNKTTDEGSGKTYVNVDIMVTPYPDNLHGIQKTEPDSVDKQANTAKKVFAGKDVTKEVKNAPGVPW